MSVARDLGGVQVKELPESLALHMSVSTAIHSSISIVVFWKWPTVENLDRLEVALWPVLQGDGHRASVSGPGQGEWLPSLDIVRGVGERDASLGNGSQGSHGGKSEDLHVCW